MFLLQEFFSAAALLSKDTLEDVKGGASQRQKELLCYSFPLFLPQKNNKKN